MTEGGDSSQDTSRVEVKPTTVSANCLLREIPISNHTARHGRSRRTNKCPFSRWKRSRTRFSRRMRTETSKCQFSRRKRTETSKRRFSRWMRTETSKRRFSCQRRTRTNKPGSLAGGGLGLANVGSSGGEIISAEDSPLEDPANNSEGGDSSQDTSRV